MSLRPDFPRGMRCLLMDADPEFRLGAEEQLRQCGYDVVSCSGVVEAAAILRGNQQQQQQQKGGGAGGDGQLHFALLEARLLLPERDSAHARKLVKLCRALPFVLMSSAPNPNEVMLGIRIGAAEFLEKPLCTLKLKNIWQHVVRRAMVAGGGGKGARGATAAAGHAGAQYQSRRFSYTHPSAAHPRTTPLATSRVRSLSHSLDASLVAASQAPSHVGGGCWGSPLRLGSPEQGDEEGQGPSLLNLPSSPLTSGLFSSPAASSASCEFLLEPLPPSCTQGAPHAAASQPGEVDSHPAPIAPPARPRSTRPSADRRRQSREQQHQQRQRSAPCPPDVTSHPAPADTAAAAAAPLPPPPPPDLACSTSAHGHATTCELPPPPPLCAPGMPWCPPTLLLPPGMEWGMPMNPMAVAPGITPPIFPQPAAAAPANGLMCAPPPPLPLPPAPGVPACMPPHNPALMPLPMHLLSAACGMPAAHGVPQQQFPQHQHEGMGANSAPCSLLQRDSSLLNSCELPVLDLSDPDLTQTAEKQLCEEQGGLAKIGGLQHRSSVTGQGTGMCRQRSVGLDAELDHLDLGSTGGGFKKVDSFVDLIQPLLAC